MAPRPGREKRLPTASRGPGLYPDSIPRASQPSAPGDRRRAVFEQASGETRAKPKAPRARSCYLDSLRVELYWGSALILKSQKKQFAGEVRFTEPEARSSVVEHYLDTVGVDSSILPAPTNTTKVVASFLTRPTTA